jgi:hypothetical protein
MSDTARGWSLVACSTAVLLLTFSARGETLRTGGAISSWGAIWPIPSASASLDAFLGLGDLEASSRTEYSLFPYTLGSETVSLGVVRDGLSLSSEYEWSLLPLGITQAIFRARAVPAPWDASEGEVVFEFAVEGEARLIGDSFVSAPLRAEVWARGTVSASRSLGMLDQVLLGTSIEATLSAPGGEIWPIPGILVSAAIGPATLSSTSTFSLGPALHLASETVSLRGSWREVGLSGEISLGLAEGESGFSLGLRISYEFGDTPRRSFPAVSECSGGVCR